jgi:hypothetical protein
MTSLFSFIKAIQQKPKHIRSQYAFWISLLLTLAIASVWGYSLKEKYASDETQPMPLRETESSFFSEFGEVFKSVRDIPSLFRGTVEYAKEPAEPAVTVQKIDLDALVASSTKANIQKERSGATTSEQSDGGVE